MKSINYNIKLKYNRLDNRGYTLIELIAVVTILAIISLVSIPIYSNYIKIAKEEVCNFNCSQLERMYDIYLLLEDIEHSDAVFEQYLHEYWESICPENGEITYTNGKVQCSIHSNRNKDNDASEDGSIPFL